MSLLENRFSHLFNRDDKQDKINAYQERLKSMYEPKEVKQTNQYVDSAGRLFDKYANFNFGVDSEGKKATSRSRSILSQMAENNVNRIKQQNAESFASVPETNNAQQSYTSPTGNAQQPSTTPKTNTGRLGAVSAKYETGGWNVGKVSSGKGDYGGISYGIPQFSTTTGSADTFVSWLKQTNPEMGKYFGSSKAGTSEFSNAWSKVASQYGDSFGNIQTQYAYDRFVKPLADKAKKSTGVDYTSSPALLELIYSTAIQFGGGSLGLSALGNVSSGMSERDIINASYDKKINNVGSFFKSSSKQVQNSVRNRFANERNDVLSLL